MCRLPLAQLLLEVVRIAAAFRARDADGHEMPRECRQCAGPGFAVAPF